MTWNQLEAEKRVKAEPTSKAELDQLRDVVARNLKDAEAGNLSADGRYGFAYSAARTLASMVVRASGYRVTAKMGGHYYTFVALETADAAFSTQAAGFDSSRGKRNDFSYGQADVVTDTEAAQLLAEAQQFQQDVEKWIATKNPTLV